MNTFRLSFLAFAAGTGLLAGAADPVPGPPARVLPTPDKPCEPPLALVQRGSFCWLGDFDKDGNFIRLPGSPPHASILTVRLLRAVDCTFEALAYEHRSGRALKGTMAKITPPIDPATPKALRTPRFVFVPEIGSTVLDLKDVDLKKPDRAVWNMPEAMPAYVAERVRRFGDRPAPKAPEPPPAGVPDGWEFVPPSRLPGVPPRCARAVGDVVEFGHLSDEGEFVPDPTLPAVTRAGVLGPMSPDLWAVPRFYTVPRADPLRKGPEPVYEFRSGRLIRGELHASGNFVPELGSTVLDFKDWNPEHAGRRVYNLPGSLKKKGAP